MLDRFARKWLTYDAQRAPPNRLAARFIFAVAAMLAVSAAFAAMTSR